MAGRDETAEIPLSLIGEYPNRWESSTLGRACSLVTDGTHDSPKETQTGFPLVTGRCITGGRINLKAAYFISEKDHKEVVARSKPEFGDILFANIGNSIGEMARVETNAEFSIKNVALFKPGPRLESLFLKYYLLSAPVQSFIRGNTFGSAQPFVGLGTLRAFPIPLPPLAEQKAIAAVLGALDDKIELNRRMNATLEAMARALFQSWFVDFDPVRRNLDFTRSRGERGEEEKKFQPARSPLRASASPRDSFAALDPATAALFPDSFQDSSLGPIPHGWEVCPLSEKIQLLSGGTPKTSEPTYWDGDIPWYSVRDAPSETDVWVIHTDKHVTKLGIANSAAQIFPEKTTIISARGTVGKLALTAVPMAMNQSCYGVRGITGYSDYFTYYSLREATAKLQQRTHGTVFDTITTETFKTLDCIFPTPQITAAFDKLVEPLLGQIRANLHQSRTLATLRDTLLPKLLSGELSVAGIESKLEAVT